jgi:hypothetical protein
MRLLEYVRPSHNRHSFARAYGIASSCNRSTPHCVSRKERIEDMNKNDFFQEILENGNVWIAIKNSEVLILSDSEGNSALPVWPNRENAVDFISNESIDSLGPIEIPLSNFKMVWLSEGAMDFNELIINPKPKEPTHLALPKKEFLKHI